MVFQPAFPTISFLQVPNTMASNSSKGTPKLSIPEGNDNVLEKAAAPIATLASHADPWPHYIMSGACELPGEEWV
jgi:hypothetical protein